MSDPTYPLTVSLRQLQEEGACDLPLGLIRAAYPGAKPDDRLSCEDLVDVVGFHGAIWGGVLFPTLFRALNADFAAHVLPVFENARPGDFRPRRAILAARFTDIIGLSGLSFAANEARATAWEFSAPAKAAAAAAAAFFATSGIYPGGASDAACKAANDADAERAWQIERLKAYCRGPVEPWPLLPANGRTDK